MSSQIQTNAAAFEADETHPSRAPHLNLEGWSRAHLALTLALRDTADDPVAAMALLRNLQDSLEDARGLISSAGSRHHPAIPLSGMARFDERTTAPLRGPSLPLGGAMRPPLAPPSGKPPLCSLAPSRDYIKKSG